jgi:hypothetical protein
MIQCPPGPHLPKGEVDIDSGLPFIIIAIPNAALGVVAARIKDAGIILVIAGDARGFDLVANVNSTRAVTSAG